MLSSLKTLVENQLKLWLENTGSPILAAKSAPKIDDVLLGSWDLLAQGGPLRVSASSNVEIETTPQPATLATMASRPAATISTDALRDFFSKMGLPVPAHFQLPETNPYTFQKIDWGQEISRNNLDSLSRASLRRAKVEILSEDARINRLTQLLLTALQSGNITMAMMIFSHIEARTANQITRCLMEKMQNMQDQKRKLAADIQNQKNDAEGSKNIQKIKSDVESLNDDISVLQTFIRDVAQNKQASLELANAFISKEHETTMAIVRSFGR